MTPERIAELRRIGEAATKGPWKYRIASSGDSAEVHGSHFSVQHNAGWTCDDPECDCAEYSAKYDANGEFIATARNEWPALLDAADELERLRADESGRQLAVGAYRLALVAIAKDDALECRCGIDPYTGGEQCPKCTAALALEIDPRFIDAARATAAAERG